MPNLVSRRFDMFRRACTHLLIVLSIFLPSVLSHHEGAECGCVHFKGVCKLMRHCPEMGGMPFGRAPITCGYTYGGHPIVCCPKHWAPMGGHNNMRPHFNMNPMNFMNPFNSMTPMGSMNPMNSMTPMNSMNPHFNMNPGSNGMFPMFSNNWKKSPQIDTKTPSTSQPPSSQSEMEKGDKKSKIDVKDDEEEKFLKPKNTEPISAKKCEEYNDIVRGTKEKCPEVKISVVGGEEAVPKEAPFMALIGYGSKNSLEWMCGGSLISPRFVLSAAHCTTSQSGPPTVVRLGDLDIARTDDDALPTEYDIETFINHPEYKPSEVYNDIALLRLRNNVQFNDYIKPICLPEPGKVGWVTDVIAAGWGRIDFVGKTSPTLMKVELDGLDIGDCNGTAENNPEVPKGLDDVTMLCAGKLDGGKDTCSGDSGGPLFLPPRLNRSPDCELRTQVGITSFGKQCGLQGYPGVYTKVEAYVPWIESHVWAADKFDLKRFIWTDK